MIPSVQRYRETARLRARIWDLASTASAADSLRSLCGSVRSAPECSSQRS